MLFYICLSFLAYADYPRLIISTMINRYARNRVGIKLYLRHYPSCHILRTIPIAYGHIRRITILQLH